MESGDSAGEKSTTLWCCPLVLPSIIRASKNFATELIRMMQTGVTPLSSLTHLGENIWQIELNFTNYLVSSDLEWKA